jgi:hypothetical protein
VFVFAASSAAPNPAKTIRYIDLGKTEHTFGTIGLGVIATEARRTTDNIVRLGVNYRWVG